MYLGNSDLIVEMTVERPQVGAKYPDSRTQNLRLMHRRRRRKKCELDRVENLHLFLKPRKIHGVSELLVVINKL